MLLHDTLKLAAIRAPAHVALLQLDHALTYAQLDARTDAVAAALRQLGVTRGDRVATMIENSIDAVVAAWGALKAGAVLVPLGPALRAKRLSYIFGDCTPAAIIASPETAAVLDDTFRALPSRPAILWTASPDGRNHQPSMASMASMPPAPNFTPVSQIDQDLAAIIYTSGTTGEPKGVMLTHRNLVNTTGVISAYLRNSAADVVCCILPMWFSYGLCQALCAPLTGYTLLIESSFAFPFDVFKRLQKHRATGLAGVPAVFAKLLKLLPIEGVDLSSIRYMTNAAAGLPPAHVLRLREAFPAVDFYAMYGQTECTRALFLDPTLAASAPESVGRAIANSEAYLLGDDGLPAPDGSTGQLIIRGANVMRGYWNRPTDTAEKLRDGPIPGEKVLHTGDLFRTDAQGLFYFVSRNDDIFKCRGEKVSPQAIENVIYELPEVAEAAVIGVEDANDGFAVKAFVVPREGHTLTEARVRQHCHARLEPILVPRFVELRTELPKTDSGKLRRADLRTPAPSTNGRP